jgi:L-malate glycosyltransferase
VLLVAPSLRFLGGQAIQAKYLLEHLSEEPSLEILFLPHDPQLPGSLKVFQSIKYIRTVVTTLIYCVTLLLRIPRCDVIHIFSASYFSFLLAPTPAILIAKLFGKRVILNYRSGEAEDHLRCWPRTAVPMIRLANDLVVPSQYLVNVFAKFGLMARAIPNIVNLERFRFRQRSPLLPRFLSNRNFYPLYNVGCVLKAFAIIQRKFPEASLILAGDGSQRACLESLARELKLRNVEFRGAVAPEKMKELYDESHIFLNASNIDNMPVSILESFASGVPVVTTNAGGIPYFVSQEKTGLLVPLNDHEALASSAMRLLTSQGLASRIAANAFDSNLTHTWPAVRDAWVELYMQGDSETVTAAGDAMISRLSEETSSALRGKGGSNFQY